MKSSTCWMLVALLVIVAAATAADFTVRPYKPSSATTEFEAALDTSTYPAQLQLARDYRDRYPDDMGVQMRASAVLAMDNLDSTRAYYVARAERQPDSEVAAYLAARLMQSPDEQRKYADRLLAKDPDSYWGNMLAAGSYTPENDPGFKLSEAALRKAIAKDNSLPFAVERLGHLLRARGETEAADAVYVKLGEMQPTRFEPVQYRLMLLKGDQQKAIKLIDAFLADNPKSVEAMYAKARGQREVKDWDGHIATMRKVVEVSRTGDHAYDLACGFSLAGQPDSAFAWLFTASDLGFTDLEQYKSDDDLIPLRDDARWTNLLAKVQTADQAKLMEYMKQAAATAPQRKDEALSSRLMGAAPDFSLTDLDGKTVSLSSLKGKVVILDFWATWCGPCKKSMPLLDKFYTDKRPKDVEIYGVNVWERNGNTSGVKPFITDHQFHFPVLLGNNEIADAYGVRGIPTLVVIDKEGKLAYRHVGYDPTIGEILDWQTQSLLK
jgi:thiol-disulfide isomerase/thioredoxin